MAHSGLRSPFFTTGALPNRSNTLRRGGDKIGGEREEETEMTLGLDDLFALSRERGSRLDEGDGGRDGETDIYLRLEAKVETRAPNTTRSDEEDHVDIDG